LQIPPCPEKRTEQEALTIERIKMADRYVGKCSHLFEEFARLFWQRDDYAGPAGRMRAQAALQQWMEKAREAEILELKAFTAKLFQDTEAVTAAMV
jgi:hypothetical protein